ncbi:hypothetical protein HKD37_07G019562 [Glycine soja]
MVHIGKWSSFCLRKMLSSSFVHCIIDQTTTSKLDLFFNTIALALVVNIIILVVQYASMFVLNSALKGLDDTPQSKSKVATRQKGSIEYGYYVMYCMSTIILGSFKNNWEIYFNDAKSLEPERLKKFRIQRATYYLKVKNETISV